MCENAIDFIDKYVVDVLDGKFEMKKSYDLWEEYEGVSLYSMSAIFGAYNAILNIYKEVVKADINI